MQTENIITDIKCEPTTLIRFHVDMDKQLGGTPHYVIKVLVRLKMRRVRFSWWHLCKVRVKDAALRGRDTKWGI